MTRFPLNFPRPAPSIGHEHASTIGARIRAARKTLNLNQEALAARLGVTQPTVANWEADVHNPRQLMLAKLSEALGVTLGWLAGGEPNEPAIKLPAAAAYLSRALYHVPVVLLPTLTELTDRSESSLRAAAIDFIPLTGHAGSLFATFLDPAPYRDEFPGETMFVFDQKRIDPIPATYALLSSGEGLHLHYWTEGTPTTAPPALLGHSLGTLALTIRVF